MKKVVTKNQNQTITITIGEVTSREFYILIRDNPKFYRDAAFLRYEPTEGWIFRHFDSIYSGHSGHHKTFIDALNNIVENYTCYQFDSFIEVIEYINSLNLIRSS